MAYNSPDKQYVLTFSDEDVEISVYLPALDVDFLYHLITKTRKEVFER